MKVMGHRNEKSLDDYDKGDENEQRQPSHTISNARNISNQSGQGNSSNLHNAFNNVAPFNPLNQAVLAQRNLQMPNYISGQNDQHQSLMNVNSFYNCEVTFNIGSRNSGLEINTESSAKHADDAGAKKQLLLSSI